MNENFLDRIDDQRVGLKAGRDLKCTIETCSWTKVTLLWTHYETTMGQYWGQLDDRSFWGKARSQKAENILDWQWCELG